MKTSSFFQYRGEGRVSISRSMPKGISVPEYRALAPGSWFRSVSQERYRSLYFEQLSKLKPNKVYADLRFLGGEDPVLLCFENLSKPGEWCHRRMVAEWLEKEIGLIVPEMDFNVAQPVAREAGLF